MTATESQTTRRTNARGEACCACGAWCDPGAGYLYRAVDSRTVNRLGRFGWKVKCAACHATNATRASVAQANQPPSPPKPRPWSVTQVAKWTVSLATNPETGEPEIYLAGPESAPFVTSGRDPISSRFTAPTDYELEQFGINGRHLSLAAAEDLSERIWSIVRDVQVREDAAIERAAEALRDHGAVLKPCGSGYGFWVTLGDRRFALVACLDAPVLYEHTPGREGCRSLESLI